jgi:hypothetical protein
MAVHAAYVFAAVDSAARKTIAIKNAILPLFIHPPTSFSGLY